eukprot:4779679-Lingulodinium_polyedra.AAC.1
MGSCWHTSCHRGQQTPKRGPAAAKTLLRSLLVGTDGINAAGVSIPLDGNSHIVYVRFCRLIGDEVATKTLLDSKRFAGIKFGLQERGQTEQRKRGDKNIGSMADGCLFG